MDIDKLFEPFNSQMVITPIYDADRINYVSKYLVKITDELKAKGICKNLASLPTQIKKLKQKPNTTILLDCHTTDEKGKQKPTGYGRLLPKGKNDVALVSISRPIRQFLIRHLATDIDIKNCAPVCMAHLYEHLFSRKLEALDIWNREREDIFKRVIAKSNKSITRDDAKTLAYVFMYDGPVDYRFQQLGLNKKDPALADIYKLMCQLKEASKNISDEISTFYSDFWNSLNPSDDREEASKMSQTYQHIEKHLVVAMSRVAVAHGYAVLDICHDGFLVSKDNRPLTDEEALSLCNACVESVESLFGMNIEVIPKPMDDAYTGELEKRYHCGSQKYVIIESDREGCDIFRNRYSGRLKYCNDQWYIRPLGQFFWRTGEFSVRAAITDCNFVKSVGSGDKQTIAPYGDNDIGGNHLFNKLKESIPLLQDDKFLTDLNDLTRGLVYFEDKHYSLKEQKWIENDVNSSIAPVEWIDRPAPDFKKICADKKAWDNFLLATQNIDEQQRSEFCHIIGRMVGGYVTDKKWLVLNGLRDTGKSSLTKLIYESFGGYCSACSTPFGVKGSDGAQKNRWILTTRLNSKRIAIGAEKESERVLGEQKQVPLDGNLIKSVIANGYNDSIVARLHNKGETTTKVNASFIFSFNGIPNSSPSDAMKTCIPFTVNITYTDKRKDFEAHPSLFRMRDQAIADLVYDPDVQNCFVWACLSKYYKDCTFDPYDEKHSTAEEALELADKGEITPLYILEKYFVTDPESRLDRDEVLTFFQSKLSDPNFSSKRLSRYLKDGSSGQIVKMIERNKKEEFPSGYSYRCIAYKDREDRLPQDDSHDYIEDLAI